jgi:predicted SprT family Zn-dependent metalloprotease
MSNCRLKYAKDITDNIIKESNLDNTSAIKLKENVNQYLLPIGGKNGKNEKLQTIKNTYEWAKSIQDWANNHYDSKRLGNTVYINDDPQGRGTIVTIMIPKLLIDAYENKFGQMSNEDFNSVLDKKEYYDSLDKAAVEDSIKNDKQDTHLREKYFANSDESSASRILRRISKTSHPLAKLAEKLESYVSINDVTIKLVPKIKYTEGATANNSAGVYYHNTNSIEIAEYANFPAALAESVLIHEIIHALTVKQLRSNSTVNKDFNELYEYVKSKLPAYNKANNTGTYATTTLDEFMVGIFTDSNFIKQLKDIPPFKGKNKYKNFLTIFNIKKMEIKHNQKNNTYTYK